MADSSSVQALILGAGRDPAGKDGPARPPKCLVTDPQGSRVLDWILSALHASGIDEITFVGGYHIEEVGEKYPNLNYVYNPEWETSGVLESLYHGRQAIRDSLLVSYADIVYHPDVCKKLVRCNPSSVTIAFDSSWRGRDYDPGSTRKNLVVATDGRVTDIGFLPMADNIAGEFIGLAYFGPGSIAYLSSFLNDEFLRLIGKPFEQAMDVKYGYLTDLLRHLMRKGVEIDALDIGPEWAEIDDPSSLARFVLRTKGETLSRLAPLLKKGTFCKQQVFRATAWQSARAQIVTTICNEFAPHPICVRSSAATEDSWKESFAGVFESVLNVDSTDPVRIADSIDRVVSSYSRNGCDNHKDNQVLVQKMVQQVAMSGVVLTRDLNSGAPYFVVNYDDVTKRTDSVTSGNSRDQRTVLVSRSRTACPQNPRLRKLLETVRELEDISGCSTLDIEFAIDAHEQVYVLQVRPITTISQDAGLVEIDNSRELDLISEFVSQRFIRVPYLYGETTVFGDMPDWNPAEMIGTSPRPLALSLYDYLIMQSAWRVARSRIGYHDPDPASLMVSLAGHPYVDVRCSFNNLLPAGIPDDLAERLVNHYINRLKCNPDMHDKVEFEVCFTCLDFDFRNQSKRLLREGFSADDVSILESALHELTNNIVAGHVEPIDKLLSDIRTLRARNQKALQASYGTLGIPMLASQLLDDCVTYGTIPFSILARYAFIANSLLRSLVARGALTSERQYAFLRSVDSVATQLVRAMDAVIGGQMSREAFLSSYGHLRPGTYDIVSPRYDESPESYFGLNGLTSRENQPAQRGHDLELFELTTREREAIEALSRELQFSFAADQMFAFMRAAISLREYAKFEFTKTVSEVLVLLCRLGEQYDISRDDLSYLTLQTVRSLGHNVLTSAPRSLLLAQIARERESYERAHMVRLPHLITSVEDIAVMELPTCRPNYVTLRKVSGRPVLVDHGTTPTSLRGNIAVIRGADPGFDWIFAHDIAGLITMYGGSASHMTIRASEFDIPAAIGCGEVLFNRVLRANIVELNCAEGHIATI
ncbi:MAG: NTP transferase domain-containing protein [Chloroflexi bacterium]|nr:NTP transferase domain-containing protein [Chloroflexota bacterium]